MSSATLKINSRNYGAWSLRGWLLCKLAGLDVDVEVLPGGDPSSRVELLLLAPSFLVPRLTHGDVEVWDTMAIAEYLHELLPEAELFPSGTAARAQCRSICGEMHSGFANLRSALPMNLKSSHPGFRIWSGAEADIDRIAEIWRECLARSGGPYLFGARPGAADAMFAPVCATVRVVRCRARRPALRVSRPHAGIARDGRMDSPRGDEPDELEELDTPMALDVEF